MKNGFRVLLAVSFVGFAIFTWVGIASRSWPTGQRSTLLPVVSTIAPEAQQRILPGPLPEVVQTSPPTTQPEMARSVIDSSTVSIQSP